MKLDHLVILAADLDASTAFYDTLLPLVGFTKTRPHVYGNSDEVYLDIQAATEPEHHYRRHAPGLNHIGFTATGEAELQSLIRTMQEAGYQVPEVQHFADGLAVFIKDPDGMRIEIATYS